MVSVGLSVERGRLRAFNQIYSVLLPEQCSDLITRDVFCVPVKKSAVHT